jgi:hypothetical protein
LELGGRYQLAGIEPRTAPFGRLSYVLPGAGFYALTPPRFSILFPFFEIRPPQTAVPAGLAEPEPTAGLLPMVPIVVFVAALPWIWRRRPAWLGRLAAPLLLLAFVGTSIPLLASYESFAPTERYEVEFAPLLVLGGVAAWLSLAKFMSRRWSRLLLGLGGGVVAAWGCATGFATTFQGSGTPFAVTHPATWRTLEDIGSPVSTLIAAVMGHPVVAEVTAGHEAIGPGGNTDLETRVTEFSLGFHEQAALTVVSPFAGKGVLVASVALASGGRYKVRVFGPGDTARDYPLPADGGPVEIPVSLNLGLNRLALSPMAGASTVPEAAASSQILLVRDLSVKRSH